MMVYYNGGGWVVV